MAHALGPGTREADRQLSLRPACLCSEFQDSQGYLMRPSFDKCKNRN